MFGDGEFHMNRTLSFIITGALVAVASLSHAGETTLNGHVFTLPDGFEIELLAGPDLVPRPITAAFDEEGRLYVADSSGTNDKVDKQLADRPHRIMRLEDTDNDGKFDKSVVFADKMMFPEGTLWHAGSLYVTAPPSIWKLTDTDGDGVADQREEWFKGKTLNGCANDLHGPYLGPDGWIYWCKGAFEKQTYERVGKSLRVIKEGETPERTWSTRASHIFRCRPDGTELEVVMTGGMDNPVDVIFSSGGERIFTTTFLQNPGGGKRDGLIHAIYGGVYGKQNQVIEDHQRTGELMPPLTHLGPAAPCGLAIYESNVIPEFRTNLFACQFNLRKVSRHVVIPDGASLRTEDHDFLVSTNLDFHPTDVLEDADGSLIVVDTGGWYKLCCPTSQLHKPDILGAIYRIRKVDAENVADPRGANLNWAKLSNDELAALLPDGRIAVRNRAIEMLAERAKSKPTEVLASIDAQHGTKETWYALQFAKISLLARIDHPKARELTRNFLSDNNDTTRQAALQMVSLWRDEAAVSALRKLIRTTTSARNHRVAAEALGRIGAKSAVPELLESAQAIGDDRALEHALIYALIEIADYRATAKGLDSTHAAVQRVALIALDQMEGNGINPQPVAELLSSPVPKLKETAAWIIGRHPEWGGSLAGYLSLRLVSSELTDADRAELEEQLALFAKNSAVEKLLANAASGRGVTAEARASALAAMRDSGLKELPADWAAAIVAVLEGDDLSLAGRAIAAARAVPASKANATELAEALVKFARRKGLAPDLKLDALAATPGGVKDLDGETFIFLRESLATDKAVATRSAAADVLAKAKLSDGQLTGLAHVLAKAGPLETDKLLSAFEQSTDEQIGLKVLASLKASPGRAGLRPGSLEAKLAKYPASVQKGAFELAALANVDLARQRAKLEELVEATKGGDVRRGQAVFMRTKTACNVCHQFGYVGGGLGPDLTRIGGIRTERDLLEAIAFPNASFVRSFEPITIVTTGGKSFTGLVKKESSDAVILATSATETARIPRDEIEELRPGTVSIMPSGLEQQLTIQELADLIAFLKNAK